MKHFFAHSTDNPDKSEWQLLEDHLPEVARLSEKFASVFTSVKWGKIGWSAVIRKFRTAAKNCMISIHYVDTQKKKPSNLYLTWKAAGVFKIRFGDE